MALTAEQIAEARKEGYSDDEILSHYAKVSGADIEAARKEGYSNSEILSHLSGADVLAPESEEEFAAPKDSGMLHNPALSGALGAGAGAAYSMKTVPLKMASAFGNAIVKRIPQQTPTTKVSAPGPNVYTTPSGIPVEQTPGGLHPGAVGNAQFNVEQQQANVLRQNMEPGFEQRGTSRIMTPVGMEKPAAALGGAPNTIRGSSILSQKRAEGWPIVREVSEAVKSPVQTAKRVIPAVTSAVKGAVPHISPMSGAIGGYNLQEGRNRELAGDELGAKIGYAGAASQVLPKFKGKAALIKPVVGLGAAAINKLRGEPESVMNKAEGGVVAPHLEHQQKMAAGGAVKSYAGGKLVDEGAQIAKKGYELVKGYLEHTPKKPNPLVGTRYETRDVSNLMPIKPGKIEDLKGAVVQSNPWDDTSRGIEVLSVSGKKLTKPVETHGGQQYVRDVEHAKQNIGGASGRGIATRVQNRANEGSLEGLGMGGSGEVILMPSTMGQFSGNFAKPTWEIYHDLFKQAEPNKKQVKEISERLRNTKIRGRMPFEFAPDLLTEESARIFENNPDFRKAFVQMMQLKGNQKMLGANAEDIAAAMADPELHGVPRGFVGHTGIEMMPGAELRPSTNASYDTDWLGKYRISLPHTPMQVMLKRRYDEILPELQAKYPKSTPTQLDAMTLGALETRAKGVSELMDEEAINRIGQYHEGLSQGAFDPYDVGAAMDYLNKPGRYAEGGKINMDKGGLSALTKKALRKYGVGLGLTAPFAAEAGHEAAQGNIGSAVDLASGFLPAPLMAAYMGLSPSELGAGDTYPGRQGTNPLAGSGSVMENYVPHMAGGGSTIKRMMNEVMQAYGPKAAKEIVPGAPHTYPPQATGPWMRDYQSAAPEITYMGKATKTPYYSSPEAQQDILNAADIQRMKYLQRIADPNSPGNTLEDLMKAYPRYESWMR